MRGEQVVLLDGPMGRVESRGWLAIPTPDVLRVAFHRDAPRVWMTLADGDEPQGSLWDVRTYGHQRSADGKAFYRECPPTGGEGA